MNIILVHSGSKKINYVIYTLKHLIKFKNHNIYFIADTKTINFLKKFNFNNKINLINIKSLKLGESHIKFRANTRLDKKSFGGFWFKTLDRFFLMQNFCEKIKLDNIIHIENDVLIFQDLSKFKKVFQKFYNIGMTFLNFNLCVPGFVYFKNYKKLNFLCDYITDQNKYFFQKKNKTDMYILGQLYNQYKNNEKLKIRLLPTMTPDLAKINNIYVKKYSPFYKYHKYFDCIFDACAIGQKIGGLDRKFHKHKGPYSNPLNLFKIENLEIGITNSKKIKKPYIKINNKKTYLLNIHMHSKKTNYFFNSKNDKKI